MAIPKAAEHRVWTTAQWLVGVTIMASFLMVPLASGAQDRKELIPASRIIGQAVFNEQGQEIGEIDDLVIRRSGRVKKATLEVGGFLDIGDKIVAVHFSRILMRGRKILLKATRKQLKGKPEYDYYDRGLRPGYYYRRPYVKHFRYGDYPPPSYYAPYQGEQEPDWYLWTFSPGRFLASTLVDRDVINEERVPIGEVKDLIIDIENRQISKIVIAVEGIMDQSSPAAIDYEPLGFIPLGVVCDISKENVESLPKELYEGN